MAVAGVEGLVKELVSRAQLLLEEYRALEEEERRIIGQLEGLLDMRGSLVYKWVLNKVGKRYYYWYLHYKVKEGGEWRTKSVYLGAKIPDHLLKASSDRHRKRALERKLRMIAERKFEVERRILEALRCL